MVGSYVPEGVEVGRWVTDTATGVTAFYDIDTPVTLAKLSRGDHEYLTPDLIPRYNAYLSFTGGPTLRRLERRFGSPHGAARSTAPSIPASTSRSAVAADVGPRLHGHLQRRPPAGRWSGC